MRFKLNIPEYSINSEYEYKSDVLNESKSFPVLTIGRDSYIEEVIVENVLDAELIYNIQIGRYTSVAHDVTFIVDMNHDYRKPCQGRISGVKYNRPELINRKGQIVIMNDCWIGEKATILSGVTIGNGAVVAAEAVVTKDVPPYAIAAGNPARIIGYRFDEEQIEKLNLIRWWNWAADRVLESSDDLYGDIDCFIAGHIEAAEVELEGIKPIDIKPIVKSGYGEDKILFFVPDFEQDYPVYPQVIDAFVKSFSDTNCELLLYIEDDEFLQEKLSILDKVFEQYENENCYVNLYIGNIEDERSLFCQVDAYISSRSLDNVRRMDMADLFGIKTISSVDVPIFSEKPVQKSVKYKSNSGVDSSLSKDMLVKLAKSVKAQNTAIETVQSEAERMLGAISQISINQYAMNSSVNNLKYELFYNIERPIYPIVESGDKAIDMIVSEGKSLCRFGDGEFAVIAGENRQKFQHADKRLGERLNEVLHSKRNDVIVCIADTYGDLSKYNDDCKYNIRAYMTEKVRQEHYSLLDMSRVYYDTYLTRPYASYMDNNTDAPSKRFDKLRTIWNNRELLIIEGEKTRMGVGNDLFDNASNIIRILGPAENAFDKYDDIVNEALKQDKKRLVLIAMGATATVLAYDLACEGFQALDMGHIDMEYEWMLAGKGKKTEVKNKYNNEVARGDFVEEICNPKYESEIIARVY